MRGGAVTIATVKASEAQSKPMTLARIIAPVRDRHW
jgi:hypothetical protein